MTLPRPFSLAALTGFTGPAGPAAGPMSAAYATVSAALGHLLITERQDLPSGTDEHGAATGWVRGSELTQDPAALDAFIARAEDRTLERYGARGRADVVASLALHRYAWPVTVLFSLPYFLLRRVPRFGPPDVALRTDGSGRVHIGVRIEDFGCLPDDPAAGLPQARAVADEERLRTELRAAVADHLTPVLAAFRPRMRRGTRALWGMATDELAEGLWYVGRRLGEEHRAREEAALLLPGRTAPFAGGAGFRQLTAPDGGQLATRDRISCCLFYTLRPEDTCLTCPRTGDAERIRRSSELN